MNNPLPGSGPKPATIMIVGEAPFGEDMLKREMFVSAGGRELTNMLHEVGIIRTECYLTTVFKTQPPANDVGHFFSDKKCTKIKAEFLPSLEELAREVAEVNPTVILALGNTALFALTGLTSVSKWRGSLLRTLPQFGSRKLVPTYHPAAIMRMWEWRPIATRDMARALHASKTTDWPLNEKHYYVRPSFATASGLLAQLILRADSGPMRLACDIETRARQIACIGIAWSTTEALCIPYMAVKGVKGSYWSFEEEFALRRKLRILLTHPNVRVIGQNFAYDAQYIALQDGYIPNLYFDTMVMQHTLFSSMKKSLDFLASMYCKHYVYWKDDGKAWDASIDEEQYWIYNCDDCTNTFEVCEVEERLLVSEQLTEQYAFLRKLWRAVVMMMLRGVRIDEKLKAQISMELMTYIAEVQGEINQIVGYPINLASPKQVAALFYSELGLPVVKNRKTHRPTTDDDALLAFPKKEPLVAGLCERIQAIRSASVLLSTFATMPLDIDKRMRCYYNIAGTVTYRFASGENAFGSGGNLQNIPKGDDEDAIEKKKKLAAAGHRQIIVPNMRKMFVPDPGYTYFDIDLDRADLMVVIWEADDDDLRQAVREGIDLHRLNASAIFNKPMDRIEYKERQMAKMFVHGCVTAGHEVLTPEGWKPIEDCPNGQSILTCNIDGGAARFSPIEEWYRAPAQTSLLHFKGEAVSQIVTADHTMPYRTDLKGYKTAAACRLPASARLPKVVIYSGSTVLEAPELLAAFAADGSEDSYGNVRFRFHKERKIERMHQLLQGKLYTYSQGNFYIPSASALCFTKHGKYLTSHCLQWEHKSAVAYLAEQVYWDGHAGSAGGKWMSSIIQTHAEYSQTLAHLHGFGSQLNFIDRAGRQRLYRFSLNNRVEWRLSSASVTSLPCEGQLVYCPVTPTGFWLVRHEGKISVTGNSNYGGSPRTMALNCGLTVHQSELMQRNWFSAHPGIKDWHRRTEAQLASRREVRNAFGFRNRFFGRVEALLPEALAWVPQSTVSIVINKGLLAVSEQLPEVKIELQVHDSIAGQYPTHMENAILRRMKPLLEIPVPYVKPLTIGVGVSTSARSWGDVRERPWP